MSARPRAAGTERLVGGQVLDGRYELDRPIGAGGMSEIWSALHLGLDREVAIKVLRSDAAVHVKRLQEEAKLLAGVRHPAVVEVYDFGRLGSDTPYLVMELLRGETLASYAARHGGRLPALDAVELVSQLLEGLAAVHAAGVLHRDIKPENVFVIDEAGRARAKLVDFGIALRETLPGPRLTTAGNIVGTPAYLSPERILGGVVDEAADVWAVGVTLYEMLTGRLPFDGRDMPQLMRAILDAPVPYPRELELPIDGALFSILTIALRKSASERYATARDMLEALVHWRATASTVPTGLAPEVAPPAPTEPAASPSGRTQLDTLIRTKLRRS